MLLVMVLAVELNAADVLVALLILMVAIFLTSVLLVDLLLVQILTGQLHVIHSGNVAYKQMVQTVVTLVISITLVPLVRLSGGLVLDSAIATDNIQDQLQHH